jgi:hypothetical protein
MRRAAWAVGLVLAALLLSGAKGCGEPANLPGGLGERPNPDAPTVRGTGAHLAVSLTAGKDRHQPRPDQATG